ncbi:MAG: AraC family transcriptional regulator [Altererythrobacter sp.]|nr:AraC family transcriptional regulator [Altererythrobacter sp.]
MAKHDHMIEQIDIYVRFMTIGAALLLTALAIAGDIRPKLKWVFVPLLIGVIAYLINSAPQFSFAKPINAMIDYLSLSTTFFIWLFARSLFEREPPRWAIFAVVVIFTVSWAFGHFIYPDGMASFYTIHLISLALIADIIYTGWSGRGDDLIERRRAIRLFLPLLVGIQAGSILLYETVTGGAITYAPLQLANALWILAMVIFSAITLLRADAELLVETVESSNEGPKEAMLSPSEMVLQEKLEAAMADGFYRTPGLSIAALADHLDTPEHRLRALINQRLGHRNFSAFLNRYRIAEAQQILSDKAHVDLPVLTIAMDLGYNSLPTFNRAFRSQTSQTPTDFRREAFSQN